MNDHLQLGLASPVQEQQFVPVVPPKDLSVYDDAHPRPTDSLGAAELRKKMTEASDAQMAELAKDPEQYRETLETALGVFVGGEIPKQLNITESNVKSEESGRRYDGDFTIPGFSIHVPLAML